MKSSLGVDSSLSLMFLVINVVNSSFGISQRLECFEINVPCVIFDRS